MSSQHPSPSVPASHAVLRPSKPWLASDAALPLTQAGTASLARDWSQWYLTDEEDMGEGFEQGEIIRTLISCIKELGRERGWQDWLCAGDQFFAWIPEHPLVRISPDVYILDHPPPPPEPASWQTWLSGHHAPSFAVEVVSENWHKDYQLAPQKYAELGCPELVIFDPDAMRRPVNPARVPLQVWRREDEGERGRFKQVQAGSEPHYAERLGAWLVPVRQGVRNRLRLAYDAQGKLWVPTSEEAGAREAEARRQAEQAQQQAEQAQQQAEQAQQQAERAQAREAEARRQAEQQQRGTEREKRALEARVRELEALLAESRRRSDD